MHIMRNTARHPCVVTKVHCTCAWQKQNVFGILTSKENNDIRPALCKTT